MRSTFVTNQLEYFDPMLIACPSCSTHHNVPDDHLIADGSMIKCASCGHSWIESRAVEIIDVQPETIKNHNFAQTPNLPAIPVTPDADYEAARIAKAIQQVEEKRLASQRERRTKLRGWLTLAACICAPLIFAGTFPATVVKALPGSIKIYDKLGMNVNVYGFKFANISHQYVLAGKTRVLAIRGEIINISGKEKTVPSIHFTLKDKTGKNVYEWNLKGIARRPLHDGQATSFLTRVASPPKNADDFQIRFATPGKTVVKASYENISN